MFNRILLISIFIGAWLTLKCIDYFVPGPFILILICCLCFMMISHCAWLLAAQKRWHKKLNRAKDRKHPHNEFGTVVEEGAESDWQPTVDLFISAKNESRVIEKTVRNMMKIDYPNFLLWIIDDNSNDDMPAILEQLKGEFANLQVLRRLPGSYPGKSAALNEALALSRAEVVCVFDADAYVAPDFLRITLPVLAPEDVGAVQVQKKIYEHQEGFLVECQSSEYAVDAFWQMGRDLIGGAVELRGNGQLIKRNALIDVGGWNNKTITDDLDLSMRLLIANWDIRFCPHACVYEEAIETWKSLYRQRKRWAEGSIRRYLDYVLPLNAPSRLSLTERLDLMAFVGEFTIPPLVAMEVLSEAINFIIGGPNYPRFFIIVLMVVALVCQFNFFNGIRLYRHKSIPETLWLTSCLTFYSNVIWMPCIFLSLWRIMFRKQGFTWQPTEHFGTG